MKFSTPYVKIFAIPAERRFRMRKNLARLVVVLVLIGIVVAFRSYGLGQYLSFEMLKSKQGELQQYYQQNSLAVIVACTIARPV